MLLTDAGWSGWLDNSIAKHCKVTRPFVSKTRKEVVTVTTLPLKPVPGLEVDQKLSTGNVEEFDEKEFEMQQFRVTPPT